MRRLVSAIVLAAVLAVPAAAAAKQVTGATVCGADGCVRTRDAAVLRGLMNGGPPTVPPTAGAPVLRVRAAVSERPGGRVRARFTTWWVPSQRLLVAADGSSMRLDPLAVRSLVKITHGMAPLPATRMGRAAGRSEPLAGPPPQIRPAPAPAVAVSTGGGADWLLIAVPAGIVLALAGGLLVHARRHRPGGGAARVVAP
jgi:hypothetical protein